MENNYRLDNNIRRVDDIISIRVYRSVYRFDCKKKKFTHEFLYREPIGRAIEL